MGALSFCVGVEFFKYLFCCFFCDDVCRNCSARAGMKKNFLLFSLGCRNPLSMGLLENRMKGSLGPERILSQEKPLFVCFSGNVRPVMFSKCVQIKELVMLIPVIPSTCSFILKHFIAVYSKMSVTPRTGATTLV